MIIRKGKKKKKVTKQAVTKRTTHGGPRTQPIRTRIKKRGKYLILSFSSEAITTGAKGWSKVVFAPVSNFVSQLAI